MIIVHTLQEKPSPLIKEDDNRPFPQEECPYLKLKGKGLNFYNSNFIASLGAISKVPNSGKEDNTDLQIKSSNTERSQLLLLPVYTLTIKSPKPLPKISQEQDRWTSSKKKRVYK